jgi:hypothetical protein
MTENSSISKMDIIIIIILSLLVAFIIGFNIIQLIDNKLSSVSINIPPSKCNIPPIYLNLDKDKTIKLNNYISEETNLDYTNNTNNTNNIIESYGNLPDHITEMSKLDYQNISNNNATLIINKSDQDTLTDLSQNYNTMNNLPFLVDPNNNGKGYLKNKVKLVENKNSPLLRLDKIYKNKINENIKNCPAEKKLYDGYNKYNDLRKDNYANVTTIGKNLIVPYTSFPIAS